MNAANTAITGVASGKGLAWAGRFRSTAFSSISGKKGFGSIWEAAGSCHRGAKRRSFTPLQRRLFP